MKANLFLILYALILLLRKYNSHIDASIGLFLGINPKLTLSKALKDKSMTLSHG